MSTQMIRHLFPGGNTCSGFRGFFSEIFDPETLARMYVIKGGPGVGKSALMNAAARQSVQKGYAVELYHCASDPDSLDGVLIPALGVALLDGTSPHVVDPRLPGAADRIVDLGRFLDGGRLTASKKDIASVQGAISARYRRAYRFLAAAEQLRGHAAQCRPWRKGGEAALWRELREALPPVRTAGTEGRIRRFFASAVTPKGCIQYADRLDARHIWRLRAPFGADASRVLDHIAISACMRGASVCRYCCGLNSERLEHLYIEATDVLIVTENAFHPAPQQGERTLELAQYMDPGGEDALRDEELFRCLLDRGTQVLGEAKALHDELENYYIRAMDFSGKEREQARIISEILGS